MVIGRHCRRIRTVSARLMRQLRVTDEISCRRRRLRDHEENSFAADQVDSEVFLRQGELVQDRQTVHRHVVLDRLFADRPQGAVSRLAAQVGHLLINHRPHPLAVEPAVVAWVNM